MDEPYFNGPLAHLLRSALRVQHPDPWSAEIDAAVKDPNAEALCVSCLFPQAPHSWFCPHCGYPTGDYVPMMPYLQIFVVSEVLRRGVSGPPEQRAGTQVFLALFSATQYAVFAPVYWFWMLRRAQGKPLSTEHVVYVEEENA